jgi:hypothetical protein
LQKRSFFVTQKPELILTLRAGGLHHYASFFFRPCHGSDFAFAVGIFLGQVSAGDAEAPKPRGAMVKPQEITAAYNHYSVLRTIEDNFGLDPIHKESGDGTASVITGIWK